MLALGPSPGVATIALMGLVLLAFGVLLVALLAVIPTTAASARAIWPSLFAALIVAAAVLGSFLAGGWVLNAVLVCFAARIGWEASQTYLAPASAWRARALGAGASLAVGLAMLAGPAPLLPILAAVWVMMLVLRLSLGPRAERGRTGWQLIDLLLFPLLPLVGFAAGAADPGLASVVLISFVLVETFDSYALLVGRTIGRTPAFPRLSPRKTVEGLAGGAAMLTLTAALVGLTLLDIGVWQAVVVAGLAGGLAVTGDLAASRLKRVGGVKDFPQVLAHQGGLLDIADAWIATGAGLAVAFTVMQVALGTFGG